MSDTFGMITPNEMADNVFSLVGKDWMLISSGTPESYNMMAARWGGMGIVWEKNVCFIFVRPHRYTYQFLERNDHFSLSFFTEEWRNAITFCGRNSGRNVNKAKETGLIPFVKDNRSIGFEQARMILDCKKIYHHDFNPAYFLDPLIDNKYPNKDYHRMYIGEIMNVYLKNEISG